MSKANPFSLGALVFACLFMLATAFYVNKWGTPQYLSYIRTDVSGYYMYLPGFFYDNLGEMKNQQYIIDTYHPCGGNDLNQRISPNGKVVIKYSSGMAILYLPSFAIAHIWAKTANYPVDGFSYPYEFSLAMYSLLVSFIGLWISRKILLQFFEDKVTAITILSLVVATNYLQFNAISNSHSHGYLFTVYSILLYLTIKWHKQYDYTRSALIGLLCGLCALVRPTDVISILIPLLWGVSNFADLKHRAQVFLQQRNKLVLMVACAIAVGSIQLIYWKYSTGSFLYWSYEPNEGLNFLKVNFYNCMFSYRKGWLVYTPFMLLSILGFITLFRKNRALFFTSFIFVFIAFYIVFSWKTWAYGGSFSMRAVVQYYALLVFPLASFFEFCFKRKASTIPVLLYTVFCIYLNLVMHWQANISGDMDCNDENEKYYWKTFGRVNTDIDFKKYIDSPEEIPANLVTGLKSFYQHNFCPDTITGCIAQDGQDMFELKGMTFMPETRVLSIADKKGKWIRVSYDAFVDFNYGGNLTDVRLYIWLTDSNFQIVKDNNYRLARVAPWGKWKTFTLDILVPNRPNIVHLKTGIANYGGNTRILVKNIKLEYSANLR